MLCLFSHCTTIFSPSQLHSQSEDLFSQRPDAGNPHVHEAKLDRVPNPTVVAKTSSNSDWPLASVVSCCSRQKATAKVTLTGLSVSIMGIGPGFHAVLVLLFMVPFLVVEAAVTDKYTYVCGTAPADPPVGGWKRWSVASTWPGGVIPGVGANLGVDAVIPCNTGIILDISVTLNLLNITGWLKVVDPGPIQVLANYVLTMGRLTIGTDVAPYTGKVIFNLTGSSKDLIITTPPASALSAQNLGQRVFATVGGRLELNGMYGNNLGWVTLAATAKAGATALVLKGDVSSWPVGGKIAISSTDYDRFQAENVTITSVTKGAGTTTIGISPPLQYMHWGDPIPTGVPGVFMDESAEVALLTRSIVIQGHPNPVDPLIGGHFMVFQTPTPQYIRGVELMNMGQQGNLGRYPMHFHLCQDASASLVKDTVVHNSNQRCYVVHGTWNLNLDGNVGFNTFGHCFMTEDGIEFGNIFNRNLGFIQERPARTVSGTSATVSDGTPSTFWIPNPNNIFTNNVAGGAFDSGWWFEVMDRVGGPSANFPSSAGVFPKFTAIAKFSGNSAHSNGRAGLRTYPSGYRPRQAAGGINNPPETIYITDFRAYKNQFIGMFIHETDSLVIRGAKIADNAVVGIELNRDQAVSIEDSIIMGETINVGNPSKCNDLSNLYVPCKPLVGCNLPVDPSQARSHSSTVSRTWNLFGILIDQDEYPSHGRNAMPHRIINTIISNFDNKCRTAAGITANGHGGDIWTAAHGSSNITVPDGSAPLWFVPRDKGQLGFETSGGDAGVISTFTTWRDQDGSIVGSRGGYAVANNPTLLPSATACTAKSSWNGFSCPNTCYRTVRISGGAFSLVRVSDGTVLNTGGATYINVLANNAYVVTFTGAAPASVTFSYVDLGLGCNAPVVLQFPNVPGRQWQVAPAASVVWQACQGVTGVDFGSVTQIAWVCPGTTTSLQVTMGSSYSSTIIINNIVGPNIDCGTLQCGMLMPGSSWLYNDLGTQPNDFLGRRNPTAAGWKTAIAQFGYGGLNENTTIARPQANGLAWYFRKSFTIASGGCYDQLTFGYIIDDGAVVYVNGKEVFRVNMPVGLRRITPVVAALTDIPATSGWVTKTVSASNVNLMSGANFISVELHANKLSVIGVRFNLWLSAVGNNCPPASYYARASILAAKNIAGVA